MPALTVVVGAGVLMVAEALQYSLSQQPELKVVGADVSVDALVGKVRIQRPDVAVVCADDAEWDGFSACAGIKDLGTGTRVVVTGPEGDDGALLAAVKAGADGFVAHSEPLDELVSAVRQVHIGQSRIPPAMLGALLKGLIEFRREDDVVLERFASLGKREREVLVELVSGASDQVIASKLHLSPHTARTHAQNILSKLGVHSRLEATRLVYEHDLLSRFGIDAQGLS